MKKENRAILQMLGCAALWSIAGIFIKLIPWNGFAIAGIRSFFAGLTVLTYMLIKKYRFKVNKKTLLSGMFMGLLYIVFVVANKLTTAANAIVIQFTSPLFIVIFSAVFFHKKIRRTDLVAVIVTMLGIALFFFDGLEPGYIKGNLCAICAGMLLAAMYMSLGEAEDEERFSAVFIGQSLAFLIGLPFIIATKPALSGLPLLYIVILGVFQLGIPYILYGNAAKHCPPLACCLLGVVEPLLNPVWVFIFDGEAPGVFALIGAVIVISAVTLWCIFADRIEAKNA